MRPSALQGDKTMKKVLMITASLRANSNSDALAHAFAEGAKEAGNMVQTISLKGKNIAYCRGCMACQKTLTCAIRDDANAIAEKVKEAEVVVFVTPVYYYSVSGQLKTLLDRCNPLYNADYQFRDVYLLATAADDAESAVEGAEKAIEGWVDCFENARFAGTVFCGGVDAPGEIAGNAALQRAFELGKTA